MMASYHAQAPSSDSSSARQCLSSARRGKSSRRRDHRVAKAIAATITAENGKKTLIALPDAPVETAT